MGSMDTFEATGVVLQREPRGEQQVLLGVLTSEHGWVSRLKRLPAKANRASTSDVPDVFDTGEVQWQETRPFFATYRCLTRRPEIARHYRALVEASAWARFLALNAPHMPPDAAMVALTIRALDAFGTGQAPVVVHLKALFRFAREQGYAVQEGWLGSRPAAEQQAVTQILMTPLAKLPDGAAAAAAPVLASLQRWLAAETDFRFPPPTAGLA